jgi:O-antigen ligase
VSAVVRPAGWLDGLIGRRDALAVDLVVVAALAIYVVLFLAVRRATNACFFVLVVLALLHLARERAAFAEAWRVEGARLVAGALASVFIAAIGAKLLRFEMDHIDLNVPTRFLLAALLLLYLMVKRVQFVRIVAVALPLATLTALGFVLANPDPLVRWHGRFATWFANPHTLGSYAVILTFMTLLTLDVSERGMSWKKGLCMAGVAAGLLLALFAATRGGLLAILPLAALWILVRRKGGVLPLTWLAVGLAGVIAVAWYLVPEIAARALGSVDEVRQWADGSNPMTAAGVRLSMWRLSLELFAARPLTGYGWHALVQLLESAKLAPSAPPEIVKELMYGGPHNDLVMMALTHGVLGIAAYFALLFIPAAFFWQRRFTATGDARLACELGMCLTLGVFVCGQSYEMLSLKFLVSFYGLTVAGLAAQVLGEERPAASTA